MIKDELDDADLEVMAKKPAQARGEAESVIERTRQELPDAEAEAVIAAADAEGRMVAGRNLWRELGWFLIGGTLLFLLVDWRLALGGVFVCCLFRLPYFLAASVTASRDEEKKLLARELQHHKQGPPEPHPQP